MFRSRRGYTAVKGTVYRTRSKTTYEKLRGFLEKNAEFEPIAPCNDYATHHPGLVVSAATGAQTKKASFHWGFSCERRMADLVYETFVIETDTPSLITRDTREWWKLARESKNTP